jgi:hypothetical protein
VELDDTIYLDEIGNRKWYVALENIRIYNSAFNVTAALGTRTLSYREVGAPTFTTITLPEGIYGFEEFRKAFRRELEENGDSETVDGEKKYAFDLEIDLATLSFVFVFNPIAGANYEVRVDQSLDLILGFPPNGIVRFDDDFSVRSGAGFRPDISLGITDQASLRTNLVSGTYNNGSRARGLFSFSFDNRPGSLLNLSPNNFVWLPCVFSGNSFRSFQISLRSGNGSLLDLQGENWGADILLERKEK